METLSGRSPTTHAQTKPHARALAAVVLAGVLNLAACTGVPWVGEQPATASADRYERVMRVGERAELGGDLVTAASLYGQAIELDPAAAEPLIALGRISARMGDADRAAGFFAEALTIAPDNADAIRGYGSALLSLNYTEEAAEQFRQALRVQPGDARAHNGLGVADDLLGRHADAQTSYRSGLAAAPGDDSIQNNLALSLALSGRHDEAIAMLRDIAAEPGHGPRIRQNLALVYALAGRVDEAAKVARQDLPPSQVQNNVAFYQSLQGLSGRALAEAVFFANMGGAADTTAMGLPDEADIAPASARNDERDALQAAFEQEPAFTTAPVTYVTTLPTRSPPTPRAEAAPDEATPAPAEAEADEPDTPADGTAPTSPAAAAAAPDLDDTAEEEAPPPVVAEAANSPADAKPATGTGLATAAEAGTSPAAAAAPAAAPAEQQAAATEDTGEARETVSFDDVAWRLRAYLDDDPTVPVPAVAIATPATAKADAEPPATGEADTAGAAGPPAGKPAGKDAAEALKPVAGRVTAEAGHAGALPPTETTVGADDQRAPQTTVEDKPERTVAAAAPDRPATESVGNAKTDPGQAVATTEDQAESVAPPDRAVAPALEQTPAAQADAETTGTAAPVEPAAPPQATASPRQFQLQLASVKTEDGARSEWKRMQRRIAAILPDAEPQFVRAEVGSKGYFYRIRVDASPSYSRAQDLCSAVSARNVGCLVVPPSD